MTRKGTMHLANFEDLPPRKFKETGFLWENPAVTADDWKLSANR